MARLQFRHLDTVFENREKAVEYIKSLTDPSRVYYNEFGKSIIGEPIVVKYAAEDGKEYAILAIGKDTVVENESAKTTEYHIIDSAYLERGLEELSGVTAELKEEIEEALENIEELTERVDALESGLTETNERLDQLDAVVVKEIEINMDEDWVGSGHGVTANVEDNVAKISLSTDNVIISKGYEGQLVHHNHSLTDFISAVEGIQFEKVTEGLDSNVKEQYKLVDGDGHQMGETVIKIYKDSSVYKAYIGDMGDSIVSPTDPTVISGSTGEEALCIIYLLNDGTYNLVKIDVEEFLQESEFGDGLQVNNHVVSVKIDENGESFLTVGPSGVKLSGVQDAIDNAVDAEEDRAVAKEAELQGEIDDLQSELDATQTGAGLAADGSYIHDHPTHYIDEATSLADADHKLDSALKEVSDTLNEFSAATVSEFEEIKDVNEQALNDLNDKIEAEIERATNKENQIESALTQEVADREAADNELSNAIDAEEQRATDKEAELESEINGINDSLNERITNITGQEGDTYKPHNTTPDDSANYINVAESMDEADFILDQKLAELSANTVSEVSRLDNKIDNVNSTLSSEINELSNGLSNEITRATNRENEIESALTQEVADREAADTALGNRINTLEGKSIAGENAINVTTGNSQVVSLLINDEDKVLSQNPAGLKTTISVDILNENDKDYILLKGKNGVEISRVDATAFIKDGMLDSVTWIGESSILQFVFNTDSGKEVINIDFSQFVNDEVNRQIAALSGQVMTINGDITTPNSTYYKIDDVLVKYAVAGSAVEANGTLIRYYVDAEGHKYYVSNNAKDMVYSGTNLENVITDILNDINEVNDKCDELTDKVYELRDKVYEIRDAVQDFRDDLEAEIERATNRENEIDSALTQEIIDRQEGDDALWEALSAETEARKDADEVLSGEIDAEEQRAQQEEAEIWSALTQERNERISGDTIINQNIENLQSAITEQINEIQSAITVIIEENINEIESALTKEIADRQEGDNELWEALSALTVYSDERDDEIELVTAEALNDLNSRIRDLSGDISDNYYTKSEADNKFLTDDNLDGLFSSVNYVKNDKKIYFYDHDNTQVASVDTTDFIKDGMVNNVVLSGTDLVITFNTDAGKEDIVIPVGDIFDADNYYTKDEVDELLSHIDVSGQTAPIWSALTKEIADRQSGDTIIMSAISVETEERKAADDEIWSAITNDEFVISSSLNDLNDRIIDLSAITATKQDKLVSGQNIKTINNQSLLGSGNITIEGGGSGVTYTAGSNINISNQNVISVTGITVPTNVSSFNNDANYITSAYTDTNYYTKTQVDQMLSQITGAFVKVTSAEWQAMYNAGTLNPGVLYVIVD